MGGVWKAIQRLPIYYSSKNKENKHWYGTITVVNRFSSIVWYFLCYVHHILTCTLQHHNGCCNGHILVATVWSDCINYKTNPRQRQEKRVQSLLQVNEGPRVARLTRLRNLGAWRRPVDWNTFKRDDGRQRKQWEWVWRRSELKMIILK